MASSKFTEEVSTAWARVVGVVVRAESLFNRSARLAAIRSARVWPTATTVATGAPGCCSLAKRAARRVAIESRIELASATCAVLQVQANTNSKKQKRYMCAIAYRSRYETGSLNYCFVMCIAILQVILP